MALAFLECVYTGTCELASLPLAAGVLSLAKTFQGMATRACECERGRETCECGCLFHPQLRAQRSAVRRFLRPLSLRTMHATVLLTSGLLFPDSPSLVLQSGLRICSALCRGSFRVRGISLASFVCADQSCLGRQTADRLVVVRYLSLMCFLFLVSRRSDTIFPCASMG